MSDYLFSASLRSWYLINKRDLPWRNTTDPYRIWISEIILQQTRVNQGLSYYLRFMERFPVVADLAKAPLDEVLKYWQGLGYYSRARNLHKAACQIMEEHGGVFPDTYPQILALSGVGVYTAAAIASFAYRLPYAVVDGNVYRVLSRYFGLDLPIDTTPGKQAFAALASEVLDPAHPDEHNQAIMEFGALQCVPVNPDCAHCVLNASCAALHAGDVARLPVKAGKTRMRDRWFHYFLIVRDGETWLHQRTEKDIWQNLYEFPLIETDTGLDLTELSTLADFRTLFPGTPRPVFTTLLPEVRHQLSHQRIHATFYQVEWKSESDPTGDFIRIPTEKLHQYPVSRLIHRCLEKLGADSGL